jgi:CubicO group peptidase (beta-lactamase class C family)
VAASALATSGLNRGATAQSATPTASSDAPGVTPDRVASAVAQIEPYIAELLEQTGVPGVAVAVVYKDEIVLAAGYGEREIGTGVPVDADTVFQLASVSKCLASTTVAAVVGDGNASWDDKIVDLDPTFAMYDPWVTSEVTVRDLFSHRTGLVDHVGDDLEDLGYDRAEILYRLRFMPPEGRFRDHYAYTNFGLTQAAVAVAYNLGVEWEDLAFERLYKPLGMTSTSSRFDDFMAMENRAIPHVLVDDAYVAKHQRQPNAQTPAGGVSSSVSDLAQWLRLVLGDGTVAGEELIDAAALSEAYRPTAASSPAKNAAFDRTGFYGLGWNVGTDALGHPRISHSGAFALGAGTTVIASPAEQLAVIALSNAAANGVVEAIAFTFMDLAQIGTPATDYFAAFKPILADANTPKYGLAVDYSTSPADLVSPLPLDAYAGNFTNDYFGDIEVAIDGDALVLHLGPSLTAFPMRHFNNDVFLYQPVGENAAGESAVTFTVGADGVAGSLVIENLDISHHGTFVRSE